MNNIRFSGRIKLLDMIHEDLGSHALGDLLVGYSYTIMGTVLFNSV
jgi:hypothetical protein